MNENFSSKNYGINNHEFLKYESKGRAINRAMLFFFVVVAREQFRKPRTTKFEKNNVAGNKNLLACTVQAICL